MAASAGGRRRFILSLAITRRAFAAGLLGAPALGAASRAAGLGSMQWRYTLEYLRLLDERRALRFDSLASPGELDDLRSEVRKRLAEMWGPLPKERSPLNSRHLGTLERDGYRIEKIIFESRPEFYVTANFYRPQTAEGKIPAVIVPCGHFDEGKAAEPYQRFCALLARNGIAALIWDPIGQGERLQLWDEAGRTPLLGPGTKEHRALGNQAYLLGINLMQYRIWDASRAIDYLELRPEVDRARIGMAGNSGGGMATLQYAVFDRRIRAAFSSCAVAGFKAKTEALLIADPEQILYGTLRWGIDHPELLASFSPRPLLIGSALRDYVPIAAARATFHSVSKAYDLLDARERVEMAETDDVHGFNEELRLAGARFFSRWLSKTSRDIDLGEILVSSPEELRCTESGQVRTSLGGKTVLDWNRLRADRIAPRREPPESREQFTLYLNEIRALAAETTRVGLFRPERGIVIPDRVFEAGAFAAGVAIVVAEQGKDDPYVRRWVIDPLVAARYRVVALDLRGWGETTPRLEGVTVSYDWEDFFAYRGLEIGRPLLGQRIKDLLASGPRRSHRSRWTVVGVGAGALVAAHAAVLEPRIKQLITLDGLLSYRSLIEDPLATEPFSSFLPGVIGAYEVRDLYAALAPRRTLVLNPRDSRRKTVHEVKAWEQYDWTARTYEAVGATDAFEMKSGLDVRQTREKIRTWLGG